jgi:hypothetical protein
MNNDVVQVCMTATCRPSIFKQTIDSFMQYVKFHGRFEFIVNLDMVPVEDFIARKYIQAHMAGLDVRQFTTGKGNFARAVINNWKSTTADWVFNLEDDWEFIKTIDLDLVMAMARHSEYVRFPKVKAPRLDKVALQPSLWSGRLVRCLADIMDDSRDPEKQLRIGALSPEMDSVIRLTSLSDFSGGPFCDDIGREWRDEHKISKKDGRWINN